MINMYRVNGWSSSIKVVDCVKVSDKSVWIEVNSPNRKGTRRENRISSSHCYFETWDEAHKFLLEKKKKELNSLRLELNSAQGKYENLKGMKNPEKQNESES